MIVKLPPLIYVDVESGGQLKFVCLSIKLFETLLSDTLHITVTPDRATINHLFF